MLVGAVQGNASSVPVSFESSSEAPTPVVSSFRSGTSTPVSGTPVGAALPDPNAEQPPAGASQFPRAAAAPGKTSLTVRSRYDNDLNRTFLELYDKLSKQVVVQFPPEKLVKYFNAIADRLSGIGGLVNRSA